jgi:alpha-L-fucosidase
MHAQALLLLCCTALAAAPEAPVPKFLAGFEAEFRHDPRAAGGQWFRAARYGLFVHYGLNSLSPGGKRDPLPAGTSATDLRNRFRAERFDAAALADLAVAAGMRYITFTPYHGGGPYLFRSAVGHPNTLDLPARRDLVDELAKACAARGLGLFLYVHCSLQWSSDDVWERNRALLTELATQYGPLAGFWLDTDSLYYKEPRRYPRLAETYRLLRERQPQAQISFCHGVTGDEDFLTYEHRRRELADFRLIPAQVKRKLANAPVEVCTTMQLDKQGGKGTKLWFNVDDAWHRTADEVWGLLAAAVRDKTNLLLNVGLRGDGSVHPSDEAALRAGGRRLAAEGWPPAAPADDAQPAAQDR